MFRSSIIPWWPWLRRSYLPEAELLNGQNLSFSIRNLQHPDFIKRINVAGRAAMVGFLMTYIVDALTGLDVVGQTGNLVCKAGVFLTVVGVILLRQSDDFNNLKNFG